MGSADTVEIKVSQDLIRPILQEKIKIALVEAMGSVPTMAEGIIDYYLNQKCNSDGKVDSYDGYNKHRRIDIMLRGLIEECMKTALQSYMEENKAIMAAALQKYMSSKRGSAAIFDAIQKGMIDTMFANWQYRFSVVLPEK